MERSPAKSTLEGASRRAHPGAATRQAAMVRNTRRKFLFYKQHSPRWPEGVCAGTPCSLLRNFCMRLDGADVWMRTFAAVTLFSVYAKQPWRRDNCLRLQAYLLP